MHPKGIAPSSCSLRTARRERKPTIRLSSLSQRPFQRSAASIAHTSRHAILISSPSRCDRNFSAASTSASKPASSRSHQPTRSRSATHFRRTAMTPSSATNACSTSQTATGSSARSWRGWLPISHRRSSCSRASGTPRNSSSC
jgi:hypothetical protein